MIGGLLGDNYSREHRHKHPNLDIRYSRATGGGEPIRKVELKIYRTAKSWSILERNKATKRAEELHLVDCRFSVNLKAQAKVAAGGTKTVHAFIKGFKVRSFHEKSIDTWTQVSYDPFIAPFFTDPSGQEVFGADKVKLTSDGKILAKTVI